MYHTCSKRSVTWHYEPWIVVWSELNPMQTAVKPPNCFGLSINKSCQPETCLFSIIKLPLPCSHPHRCAMVMSTCSSSLRSYTEPGRRCGLALPYFRLLWSSAPERSPLLLLENQWRGSNRNSPTVWAWKALLTISRDQTPTPTMMWMIYHINMELLCLENGVPLQVESILEPIFIHVRPVREGLLGRGVLREESVNSSCMYWKRRRGRLTGCGTA